MKPDELFAFSSYLFAGQEEGKIDGIIVLIHDNGAGWIIDSALGAEP